MDFSNYKLNLMENKYKNKLQEDLEDSLINFKNEKFSISMDGSLSNPKIKIEGVTLCKDEVDNLIKERHKIIMDEFIKEYSDDSYTMF
jgi:hypothetical protein